MKPAEFFKNAKDIPYVVQYVGEVVVEGKEPRANVIDTYIMLARDMKHARSLAEEHINIMNHSYHNVPDRDLVSWRSLGIHSIEELDFCYSDRVLPIESFLFSKLTTKEDLIEAQWPRKDLPLTDG